MKTQEESGPLAQEPKALGHEPWGEFETVDMLREDAGEEAEIEVQKGRQPDEDIYTLGFPEE